MFNDNAIIEFSLQSLAVRNNIIQNNIANAELPNFKKSEVLFEDVLKSAVEGYKSTGNLDLSNIKPRIVTEKASLSYRIDGNNVDIEEEMVKLYQNDARYSTLASSIINNYKRVNLVLSAK
ncbi:MAG: flagellar basal body rod protein FlgB [Clostridiales bacterium]|jgi:flagellar basal-body rod protein FlgB|nr:flagellar basal body rod protein FlgB [Clostridiales bacterium]